MRLFELQEMARPRLFTDVEKLEMADLYAAGRSSRKIGKKFGITGVNVMRNLKTLPNFADLKSRHLSNTENPNRGIPKNFSQDEVLQMGKLWSSGMSMTKISHIYGVDDMTVKGNIAKLPNYLELKELHRTARDRRIKRSTQALTARMTSKPRTAGNRAVRKTGPTTGGSIP